MNDRPTPATPPTARRLINAAAVRDTLIAETAAAHAGTVTPKIRVSAEAIDAVEIAARREIRRIARNAFGPGKTITP